MAKLVRYCVLDEEHLGENVILVHRPFIFGNPYTHIKNKQTKALVKVSDREEAIRLYDPYFDEMLKHNKDFQKEWQRLIDLYYKYDTIYFGCFCRMNETCHSDIIIKKLQNYIIKSQIKDILDKRKKEDE